MTGPVEVDVRAALAAGDLPQRVDALGFSAEDAAEVRAAAARVLDRPDDLAAVEQAAGRLVAGVGVLPPRDGTAVWQGLPADDQGVLPLLALLATAPVVARFHASRGVPADVSAATLADLGQQTRVHRLVHGGFGLGTHAWEAGYVWSGALYRLGRLQFDLERQATVDGTDQEWVLSTHIPRGERLRPADVDASLAAALPFFAAHFAEVPAQDVHCRSWMLDARIPDLLPGSNLAAFQQRWRTYGMPGLGDEDALFFGFARRDAPDLQTVPAETSLQRAIASVWRSGNHWLVVDGRLAR
ncbi:acyltransferase domain-containing protein [Microlunatus spumicola]|uniref:Acyltransferase domain-containing protein n=1 Tax=Microlunatus spumicola TaxID=81499 RepID=A0ABP6XIN4_9ACTN